MFDLRQLFHDAFWWQPGSYTVQFSIQSANGAKLQSAEYAFALLRSDVDALRGNIELCKLDWQNRVMLGAPGFVEEQIPWSWREPVLTLSQRDNKPVALVRRVREP